MERQDESNGDSTSPLETATGPMERQAEKTGQMERQDESNGDSPLLVQWRGRLNKLVKWKPHNQLQRALEGDHLLHPFTLAWENGLCDKM